MAYRVIWSPRALDDIDSIASYIARDSPAYASTVVSRITTATRGLQQFPFAGRVVPEFDDTSLREQFVYSYRIIYRVQDRNVTVAAVVNGKRIINALNEDVKTNSAS
jgi:addiction module RelE/StbE family toxin